VYASSTERLMRPTALGHQQQSTNTLNGSL
jgi:hypothetical protein